MLPSCFRWSAKRSWCCRRSMATSPPSRLVIGVSSFYFLSYPTHFLIVTWTLVHKHSVTTGQGFEELNLLILHFFRQLAHRWARVGRVTLWIHWPNKAGLQSDLRQQQQPAGTAAKTRVKLTCVCRVGHFSDLQHLKVDVTSSLRWFNMMMEGLESDMSIMVCVSVCLCVSGLTVTQVIASLPSALP